MRQQWEDLRALFDAAWPLSAGERAQLLDERCGSDTRLRRELEKLLEAHDEGEAETARRASGTRRFGVWETIELAGRGGMAEVYLARRVDGQHEQRAALKVMARSMLTVDYMDRFRREREILARLEHPNIARLFDGGLSESGEPYMVMEYVDGARLDDYCDQHSLPLAARLRLFLTLCSAVESAHRNLILHRDIKPSNVLVTHDGTLKLVDFGTARRMDADALETMAPLTPSFASPEQLRGESVTTASDVYGLGMTLYNLVTGALPFGRGGKSAYQAVQEAVERTAPPPSAMPGLSSALCKELRGDLDNIILKAIERDPARRYASAIQLADDITRHLEKRPVRAHRNTWTYRAERFVARHRVAVVLSAMLAITLLASAAAWSVEARQARLEAARSRRLAEFLTHVMGLGYDTYSGPMRTDGASARVLDVMRYASTNLQREMAGQPDLEARVRADIGHSLAELGLTAEAEENLRRGLALVDARKDPALAAELTGYLARKSFLEGDLKGSEKEFREALRLLRAARQARQTVPAAVESLLLLNASAAVGSLSGATAEMEALIDGAMASGRTLGESSAAYALALANHGFLRWGQGKAQEGEGEVRRALGIQEAMHPRPIEACMTRQALGDRIMSDGRLAEAAALMSEPHVCLDRAFVPGSIILLWARLSWLEWLVRSGRLHEAIGPLSVIEKEIAQQLPKAGWLRAEALMWRGRAQCKSGQPAEGVEALRAASGLLGATFGASSPGVKSVEARIAGCGTR